jgi:hypothetical protein
MSLRGPAALLAVLSPLVLHTSPALACRGDCYDRTVDRPVVARPGYREVVETEPVVVMRAERVLVAPRRVGYVMTPPVTRTVFQEIVVRPGGYRWRSTLGPYGEQRRRVPVAPEIKVVPREVVVARGRRVRVVLPAVYAIRERAVAVRPAQRLIYDYPPVVVRERARVRVRRGGTGWVGAW